MIKRKLIALLLLISILATCLPGCAKVVRTETKVVDATIVDTHHKSAWTQLVWNGKFYTHIYHSAKYKVTLQYEDYVITVDDDNLYHKYKDNIGAIVKCNLVTTYYDDGTSKTKLEWENNND